MLKVINDCEDFDLVRMVESAYLKVFEDTQKVPKTADIKDEIVSGCYDLVYGPDAVSIVSEEFISATLMTKKHIHKSYGDVYFDAQVKLIPNLYTEGDDLLAISD